MPKTLAAAENPSVSNLDSLIEQMRAGSLHWSEEPWAQIWLRGTDSSSFLQQLCPILIQTQGTTPVVWLDKKGQVKHGALALCIDPHTWLLLCPDEIAPALHEYLDSMIFAEDVNLELGTLHVHFHQGPQAQAPQNAYALDLCGEGGWISLEHQPAPLISGLVQALSIQSLPLPWLYIGDLYNETRMMDLPQQSKCYPGQEIVARIRDRGQSPRLPYLLRSPQLDTFLTAYPKARLREIGTGESAWVQLSPADAASKPWQELGIQVEVLHFKPYVSQTRLDQCEKAYDFGLQCFHKSELESAVVHFRKAIEIYDLHGPSLEALGMCLEQMGDFDGAIRAQRGYEKAEPLAVMPLTNLSRLYMQKGWTDQAESYLAKASSLASQLASQQNLSPADWQAVADQMDKAEADKKRKIDLFQSALELDPDDDIALFGLGKIYADQQKFDLALPLLQKLVELQPNYSAAWAQLSRVIAKAWEADQAKPLIQQGIEVAQKQGDLMPLKLMQNLLRNLNPA